MDAFLNIYCIIMLILGICVGGIFGYERGIRRKKKTCLNFARWCQRNGNLHISNNNWLDFTNHKQLTDQQIYSEYINDKTAEI